MDMDEKLNQASQDYRRIEQAILFLQENHRRQPSLEEMAASVHLSKYHFGRLFKRWAGVTPKQFLQHLTLDYAKDRLAEAESVLDASLAAGLESPSRLHDLFVTLEAMTPGEYKRRGEGLAIRYGFHPTPFGLGLLATTDRGICALRFVGQEGQDGTLDQLKGEWPEAEFVSDPEATQALVDRIFSPFSNGRQEPFHLLLKGTNFQVQVWRALLAIPKGALVSYQDLARAMGRPKATRAVASAVARNPIGYFIPCHRVIGSNGRIHNYRWGAARKKAILGWEASRQIA